MTPRTPLATLRAHPDVAARLPELAERAGVPVASVHRVLLCHALEVDTDDIPPVVGAVLTAWDVLRVEWRCDAAQGDAP